MKRDRTEYTLTPKGRALVIAAETGLIEKAADDTLDAEKFEAFWNRVEAEIMTPAVIEEANRIAKQWKKDGGLGWEFKQAFIEVMPLMLTIAVTAIAALFVTVGMVFIVKGH